MLINSTMRRFRTTREPVRIDRGDREPHARAAKSEEIPQTPSSTSPLRENFDEVTNTRPDRSTAMYDPPTAHSIMPEDFDAFTTTLPTTTAGDSQIINPPRPVRPSRPAPGIHRRILSEGMSSDFFTQPRHKQVSDDYNEYDQYVDDTDRIFRAASLAQESRLIERPSNKLVDGATTWSNTVESRGKTNQKSSGSSSRNELSFRRAPHSKNEYAVVDTQILHQDAERTVEVSAWREQVAKEAHDNVKMSVYYVTHTDILEAGKGAFQEEFRITQDLPSPTREAPFFSPQPSQRPERHRSLSVDSFSDLRPARRSPFPFARNHLPPSSRRRNNLRAPPTPPKSATTNSQTPPSPLENGGTSSKLDRNKPLPSLSLSKSSPQTDFGLELDNRRRVGSSTSIRRTASEMSSVESLLADCEPSLLHIAPILSKLGVKSEVHLLAIIRLREETRDREIRDEALRRGITVVEWAIFVDKLLGLTTI